VEWKGISLLRRGEYGNGWEKPIQTSRTGLENMAGLGKRLAAEEHQKK
jgi:hypothetical protein